MKPIRIAIAALLGLSIGGVRAQDKAPKGTFELFASGRQTVLYATNRTDEVFIAAPGLDHPVLVKHVKFALAENRAQVDGKDFSLGLTVKHKAEGYAVWSFVCTYKGKPARGEVTAAL